MLLRHSSDAAFKHLCCTVVPILCITQWRLCYPILLMLHATICVLQWRLPTSASGHVRRTNAPGCVCITSPWSGTEHSLRWGNTILKKLRTTRSFHFTKVNLSCHYVLTTVIWNNRVVFNLFWKIVLTPPTDKIIIWYICSLNDFSKRILSNNVLGVWVYRLQMSFQCPSWVQRVNNNVQQRCAASSWRPSHIYVSFSVNVSGMLWLSIQPLGLFSAGLCVRGWED